MINEIKGVIKNIVMVISLLIICCAVALMVLQLKPAAVLSGSMEPSISTGSLILIDTGDKEIKEGDIVAYSLGDMVVTHRAVRKLPEGWVTKGDNNKSEDPAIVKSDSIVGKGVVAVPKLGYVTFGFKSLIKELIV